MQVSLPLRRWPVQAVRRGSRSPPVQGRALLLSALLVFALAGEHPARAEGSRATDRSVKACDFMNTFGVNVHFGGNNYANTQAVADALNIIGFSRIRSTCKSASEVAAWHDIASKAAGYFPAGLKADVLVTGYLNDPTTFAQQQATIPQIAPLIETLEGPNEINNYFVGNGTHGPFDTRDRTTHFASNSAAWARALYAWRNSLPSLAHVKLLAPSIASGDPHDYSRLPNVSAFVSAGNIHFYAGNGRQPSNFGGGNFSAVDGWYKAAASPTKPVSITEWGQTTASRPGQGGCDDATQAKYLLNQMFDITAKGMYRAYLYQLMDDTPDGDPMGSGGTESHFGLFDSHWGVKPAAQALANVKNLLADMKTDFKPWVPNYTVRGVTDAGASGSSLSVSKSDGSTFLVVWNEPQIWNPAANAPVAPAPDPVTVSLGGRYAYRVYDPLVGLGPVASGTGSRVSVRLTGSPLMIQVVPR